MDPLVEYYTLFKISCGQQCLLCVLVLDPECWAVFWF